MKKKRKKRVITQKTLWKIITENREMAVLKQAEIAQERERRVKSKENEHFSVIKNIFTCEYAKEKRNSESQIDIRQQCIMADVIRGGDVLFK